MRFEFKKIFSNKVICIGLIVLIAYIIHYSYLIYGFDLSNEYQRVDDKYYGEYTEEKYKLLSEQIEKITEEDFLFFGYLDCYSQAGNYKEVLEYRNNVLSNAKRLKNSNDSYIAKVNAEIEGKFSDTLVLKICDTTKIKNVTNIFSVLSNIDIFNVIIIIVMVSVIFIIEHTAKIYPMIFSSYGGRLITYTRKLACIAIFSFMLSVITSICVCILTFGLGDMQNWLLPIQSVEMYRYAPGNINLLQLVIILTVLRGIGYMTIGIICIFVTIFFKRSIFPIIINCIVLVGGLLLYGYYEYYTIDGLSVIEQKYEIYCKLKNYSVFGLLNDNGVFLKKYESLNILGQPVEMLYVNVCINIMVIVIAAVLGYRIYRRKGA